MAAPRSCAARSQQPPREVTLRQQQPVIAGMLAVGTPNITPPHLGSPGGNAISYMTFFHDASLFFLLSIAGWRRIPKV